MFENLQPKTVFKYFEDICGIPHGSGNTKEISDYCVQFAKKRGLNYIQDKYNNVIITKEASPGYESAPALIIQGHLDMVCEKTEDCDIDFQKEGLRLNVRGDYVYADGTTLGGDDGIAVAYALAVLDDDNIMHPALECIFTVDEEVGMIGAGLINLSSLKGRMLLNIDSEKEGILTVSCAGGSTAQCGIPINRQVFDCKHQNFKIKIDGLTGGHSGVEINKEHGNAIKLMARILNAVNNNVRAAIYCVDGGLKDNAIPVMCSCQIAVSCEDIQALNDIIDYYNKIYKEEFSASDSGVNVSIRPVSQTDISFTLPLDGQSAEDTIFVLLNMPNGIQAMSKNIEGLVETSLNTGILKTTENSLYISTSVRSSVSTRQRAVEEQIVSLVSRAGGTVNIKGTYSPWEYKEDSKLRKLLINIYREQYREEPEISAIHAGLECGVLSEKIEGLDCISFGPNIIDIHTPKERLSISSTQRCWKFILEILKRANSLS